MKNEIIKITIIFCTMAIAAPFLTACGANANDAELETNVFYENTEYTECIETESSAENETQTNAFVVSDPTVNVVSNYHNLGEEPMNVRKPHHDEHYNNSNREKETTRASETTESTEEDEENEYNDEYETSEESSEDTDEESGEETQSTSLIVGRWKQDDVEDKYVCFESDGTYHYDTGSDEGTGENAGTYKLTSGDKIVFTTTGGSKTTKSYEIYEDTLILRDLNDEDSTSYTRY